jgi:hypothetical protein
MRNEYSNLHPLDIVGLNGQNECFVIHNKTFCMRHFFFFLQKKKTQKVRKLFHLIENFFSKENFFRIAKTFYHVTKIF